MSYPVYNLSPNCHAYLCEALRRFECFAVQTDRKKWTLADLQSAWTGLGYTSEYQPLVKSGHMVPVSKITPRTMGWFRLTETGAKIILHWHKLGYKTEDYELKVLPPHKTPAKVG